MIRRILLPATFWHDHRERGLPAGNLIAVKGRRVLIEATEVELIEIRSDADYYSYGGFDGYDDIVKSAKATVVAIDKQAPVIASLEYPSEG